MGELTLLFSLSGKVNKNAYKSLIVAEILGVKINTDPNFEMGVSNKTPEFLQLNPYGKVPVLETPEGPIAESNSIARYVAKLKPSKLFGTTSYEAALVDQWIDFATLEIDTNYTKLMLPKYGYFPYSKEVEDATLNILKRALVVLDGHLSSRTYLVGHSITLADIILTCNSITAFKAFFAKEFSSQFPHYERYFWTMVNQPEVKKVVGEVVQGDFKLPATPPQPAAAPARVKAPKVTPKRKEAPKPEEATKPKEESEEEESEEEQSEDEEYGEYDPARQANRKSPLDLLPPSPFDIGNWKRLYSNTKVKDFNEVAIKGFWEMYDPQGWSIWFCDYKYNEENDKTYVIMNKVGGFLQRLDFIWKYAFGKVLILGEQPPYKIKGVWLFRGPEIPKQVIDECYDVELYTWTKADIHSAADKARIDAYFEEPDVIDGEKLLEAKCFK